ncbi:hypothetical protein [Paraburkholderia strydomiana]|uniref:hypothetical protein n=1 Tax=Paraburkholderia strydomiana TaxID=1245417 RepID=UPI001BE79B52|nr:hypothetical protein [Paraburkholderia strydomiana]MBT2790420.1 hypothetical protein [Paraburkholderia strydomiana]
MTEKVVDDALRLAAIYRAGVGTQWKSYRQAAEKLSRMFETKIEPPRIVEALAVLRLPSEIIRLFHGPGLSTGNARALLRLASQRGESVLAASAATIDTTGMDAKGILRALRSGGEVGSRSAPPVLKGPLAIAAYYKRGAFPSQRIAAEHMGIPEPRLSEALTIEKALPAEVKILFPGDDLTFGAAKQIVKLIALRGARNIRALAVEAARSLRTPSPQLILNRLAGIDIPGVDVRLRKAPGKNAKRRLVVELHLHESDANSVAALDFMIEMLTRFGIE